jgi:hypothetical protein
VTEPRRAPGSRLSVAEAAAVRRMGLRPAGLVLGTAVLQVVSSAWAGAGPVSGSARRYPCQHFLGGPAEHWGWNVEDPGLTGSVLAGFGLALERARADALGMGADGVVGLELTVDRRVGGSTAWTFQALGTAVALVPEDDDPPRPRRTPFLAAFSGRQLERLLLQGLVPVTVAVGAGACLVQPSCRTRGDPTVPGRVDQRRDALTLVRDRARRSLEAAAEEAGGQVLGITWQDLRLPGWGESWLQLAEAVGTVVRPFAAPLPAASPTATVALRP